MAVINGVGDVDPIAEGSPSGGLVASFSPSEIGALLSILIARPGHGHPSRFRVTSGVQTRSCSMARPTITPIRATTTAMAIISPPSSN